MSETELEGTLWKRKGFRSELFTKGLFEEKDLPPKNEKCKDTSRS